MSQPALNIVRNTAFLPVFSLVSICVCACVSVFVSVLWQAGLVQACNCSDVVQAQSGGSGSSLLAVLV